MKREDTLLAQGAAAPADGTRTAITVAAGDGIGPEIMQATLAVLEAAGARIDAEWIDIGEKVYLAGHTAGIAPAAWESLRRTRVMLKGPVTTPSGGGYKSLNVTLRKSLGLYANVRPCVSYEPFVRSSAGPMNVVVVRENEEDLYAGIEHRQTQDVWQCLKLVSRPGCEKIVRYAFEYARAHGRRKVTCMVKDNIMKMTDGLFARVFEEIGAQYPELEKERAIIDIGAARLATQPGRFDVIVAPNLYGDILSDIAAEVSGSVGLAGSANIGEHAAMFEAIHGSAPDIAGQGVANPSGLLLAAATMLVHIGQPEVAERVHNAWLATLEDGIHTADIADARTRERAGTARFADAVIERLGQWPRSFPRARYGKLPALSLATRSKSAPAPKELAGVDVFVQAGGVAPDTLAAALKRTEVGALELQMVTNRGVKVWPGGFPETFCTDHWRCRFVSRGETKPTSSTIVSQLASLAAAGLEVVKTENLYTFGGERGYSLGQGQ
jgi:isocitrate dehydrogenase